MFSKLLLADWVLHTLCQVALAASIVGLSWLASEWLDRVLFGESREGES